MFLFLLLGFWRTRILSFGTFRSCSLGLFLSRCGEGDPWDLDLRTELFSLFPEIEKTGLLGFGDLYSQRGLFRLVQQAQCLCLLSVRHLGERVETGVVELSEDGHDLPRPLRTISLEGHPLDLQKEGLEAFSLILRKRCYARPNVSEARVVHFQASFTFSSVTEGANSPYHEISVAERRVQMRELSPLLSEPWDFTKEN
jgi:hypothetical protein